MHLIQVMRTLNQKGISSTLQWVWDGGFEVYLGDEANGVKASEWFIWKKNVEEALQEAAVWLNARAREHYGEWVYLSRCGSDKSRMIKVMHSLYQSELNSGIQWSPDGLKVWLGGERSPIHAERWFEPDELDRAANWLDAKARECALFG
jgi:hypothetical protein